MQRVLPSVCRSLTNALRVVVLSVIACLSYGLSADAIVIKNLAPSGNALLGVASDLLGSDDRIVDHQGPVSEINDGVVSLNLAADGFIINADGQNGPSGNGADTFAPHLAAHIYDFAGVLFSEPQYGISSVRVQNYLANDGGWWGPTQSANGGVPLGLIDLASPQVQVSYDAGAHWTTVTSVTPDYRFIYNGAIRGSGFPNATAGPIATLSFPAQSGINGIRLIGEGAGSADGSGFIGVTEFEVYGVAPELSLEVNTVSGRVRLVNDSLSPVKFDLYRINSPSGSLNLSSDGWNSLDTASLNPDGFPVGTGNGDGWERMANLSDKLVAESFLQGTSTLAAGEFVSLGELYTRETPDLSLRYRAANRKFVDVAATYVTTPPLAADFNDDDLVNETDLTVWQGAFSMSADGDADGDGDTDGRDFLIWQRQFGSTPGVALRTIPEPGTGLISISLLGLHGALRRGQLC